MKEIFLKASKAVIFTFTLPFVMINLVLGTIAQSEIGLTEATEIYFSSFYYWCGLIPLPGFFITLPIISLNLLAKICKKKSWKFEKMGTNMTHIGALLLLIGSLVTYLNSTENFMILKIGQKTALVSSFHSKELVLYENDRIILRVAEENLKKEKVISSDKFNFSLKLKEIFENAKIVNGNLVEIPKNKESEKNHLAFELLIPETGEKISVMESKFSHFNNLANKITIQRVQSTLPFSLKLHDFKKINHPGTVTAKEYESDVEIIDGNLSWKTVISMNQPARHLGHTIYQSSFVESEEGVFSILTIVKNSGRIFPYISSIIMCLGVLIHLIFKVRKEK